MTTDLLSLASLVCSMAMMVNDHSERGEAGRGGAGHGAGRGGLRGGLRAELQYVGRVRAQITSPRRALYYMYLCISLERRVTAGV